MSADSLSSREILARLVGFDTVSARTNLPLVQWVADYLAAHGVEVTLDHDATGAKANLFASIGPRDRGGVCLHGHTDVVPVDGQSWATDPFVLTERGGRLHGRGTCDMKGWIACVLAAVPQWTRARLHTPIHVALSYDEEVGCLGAPGLIRLFDRKVPRPELALIGEPSLLAPVTAHKGVIALDTLIEGHTVHSSLIHLGASAATAAALMACEIHDLAQRWAARPGPVGMEPPGPTMSVGVLQAGVARNMVPGRAELRWDLRYRAGDSPDALLEELRTRVEQALRRHLGSAREQIRLATMVVAQVPAFEAAADSRACGLLRELGVTAAATGVAYGAEAGQYAQAGVDSVIFGPGSIAQAHQTDEFIELSQLTACDAFMSALTRWAAGTALEPRRGADRPVAETAAP
jgi:acetylornithine deacetylase